VKIKIDENLGHAAAQALRSGGHDVATVFEQDMTSSPDMDVYAVCRAEERVLVTLDTDFSNPITYPPEGGPGIAVLRAGEPESGALIRACLSQLVKHLAARSIEGRLWIVEINRVREYRTR
jgi:predicted nuclease of predicted toxin-antitoxin system